MPGKGRPPTPTAILRARGSWRAKVRNDEPEGDGRAPEAPPDLDGRALEIWRDLVERLGNLRVLSSGDAFGLEVYCRLYDRWLTCEERIREQGMFNERGYEYSHTKRASTLADQLGRLGQQFGLSPSSRATVKVTEPKQEDGKASLLKIG